MKRYTMNMGAGLDGLRLEQVPRPQPGLGEVLVAVRAVSLNYRELSILVDGRYPLPVKPDVVAVSDGAGEVLALGAGVDRVKVGDRVIASIFPRWIDGPFRMEVIEQLGGSRDGMLSEYVCLPQEALVPIPEHLGYEEASTLPCAALTAWHAVTAAGPLGAGETVLVLGTGNVSLLALQFARMCGARVIATTSSAAKAQRLRELGADAVIDYAAMPRWAPEVRRLTQGAGVDRVVEVAGGSLAESLQATRLGGHVSLVGTRGGSASVDVGALFGSGATIHPIAVGNFAQLQAMVAAIALHKLKPVMDETFAFDQAPQAFRYYAEGRSFGKVVIRVGG
ncbi:MAG: NAD(P)-dependent alcohol dehydrogenase [Ramlibacter sp.]|nr:NAD(P)-dependent alcohol dehydrogenase [Ramlibacter sp.]